jgi:circadian clock protein KaiC
VPTGIPGLDTVLRGGFLKAGIYIVRGEPGTGKTIFGNQFCFNHVAAGHRAVYVTLLAETHDRMMLHMQTMSFF